MRHPESRLRPRNPGSAAMFGCAAARWGAEALRELGYALTRVATGASRRVRPEDPRPGGFCKLCPHKAALPAPFDTTRQGALLLSLPRGRPRTSGPTACPTVVTSHAYTDPSPKNSSVDSVFEYTRKVGLSRARKKWGGFLLGRRTEASHRLLPLHLWPQT